MNETTTQLHPSFLTRMQHLLGPEYPAFLASFDAPRTYGLRLNTSKITSEAFEKLAPFSITPLPWVKNAYFYSEDIRPSRCPYYQSGLSYLVRKADAEKIKTFADLKGKTLAVQIGTTGAAYAKNVEGARVSAFNTTSEAFMDLNVKNADAVVLDRPVLAYFLKTKPRVAKNLQLSTEIADAEHFGFAVKKGNAELLQKLNAALEELKKSGEFAKIEDKWFAK